MARALAFVVLIVVASPGGSLADDDLDLLRAEIIQKKKSHLGLGPLVRLMDRRPDFEPDRVRVVLEELYSLRGMKPALRRYVARSLADVLFDLGDDAAARRLLVAEGVLLDGWRILGPVAREAVDPKTAATAYRELLFEWPLGQIELEALAGEREGVIVLRRTLRVTRAARLTLHSLDGAAIEVFVNGVPAPKGVMKLVAGDNELVVVTRRTEGQWWRLRMRVGPPTASLLEAWTQETGEPADRARVLRSFGVGGALFRSAAGLAEPVELLLSRAQLEARSDKALAILDAAQRLAPKTRLLGQLRTERARRYHERGQSLRALDEVRAALTTQPTLLRARLLQTEILADAQALGAAQGELLKLLAAHPKAPSVRRALADVYQRRQLPEAALEQYAALAELGAFRVEVVLQQLELARSLGRGHEAEALNRRLITLQPGVSGHYLSLARLLEERGDAGGARKASAAALQIFGDHDHVVRALGELHLAIGDSPRGITLLRRSLALRPHQPELRQRLAHYDQGRAGFEAPFRLDVAALIQANPPAADPPDGEYLLSQRVVRLFENGTTSTWTQHVFRVNRVNARDRVRSWSMVYDPSRQSVTVLDAARIRKDGTRMEATEQTDRDIGEQWAGLYYEQRATRVRFDEVEDGDVFVVTHRLSDFDESLYGLTFGDIVGAQELEPKRRLRLAWILPEKRAFQARFFVGKEARSPDQSGAADGVRTDVFDLKDIPALRSEAGMPGYTEVAWFAHATTFASWAEVGAWYRKLAWPQLKPGPELVGQAKALVKAGMSDAEKVAVLHEFVTRQIRYVGLEFGEHGYKPYAVDDIFARRFGDCKDKASLLKAMLAQHGIPSHITLVRTRRNGLIRALPASPAVFDHVILYVPVVDRYIDATAAYHGHGELPAQDSGASALVVRDDGAEFVTLPVGGPGTNRLERTLVVDVGRRMITMAGTLEAHGNSAPPLRAQLHAQARQREVFERLLNAEYPGARLGEAEFGSVAEINRPVRIRYQATAPREGAVVRLMPADSLVRRMAPAATRTHDLVMLYRPEWRWRFELRAAKGLRLAGLPATAEVSTPFGVAKRTVETAADGSAVVAVQLRFDATRVSPADYPAFRRFLGRVDALMAPIRRVEVSG